MNWNERKNWIARIWSHYRDARADKNLYLTDFSPCLRATVALLLNRIDDKVLEWDQHGEDVAWKDNGTYWTDYGTGYSWLFLKVQGFRVAVGEDGNL